MKVLLVEAPHTDVSEPQVDVPPLGLAYMAAVLERDSHEVRIIDLNVQDGLEGSIQWADLMGLSCYTHNYHLAVRVMKMAKERGIQVVVGGPHATALPEDVLDDGFDYAVRGEGEPSLPLLVRAMEGKANLDDVPGLVYRDKKEALRNPMGRVPALASLPLPARHLLDLNRYSYPGAVATSRGCGNNCTICSSRLVSGMLRLRSVRNVLEEVALLKERDIERIFFVDPNFASDRQRTMEMCRGLKDLGVSWLAELRLDHVDAGVIKEMGASGCKVVRFGIESGCQRMVDGIKKGIDLDEVPAKVASFVDNGITPVCGFMLGFPWETREDLQETVDLAKNVKELGGEATFSILTPYPGTGIFREAEGLGIKVLHHRWSEYHHLNPVIETKNFPRDGLRAALFDALVDYYGIDIPVEDVDDGAPGVRVIGEGIERRSFRSIALKG